MTCMARALASSGLTSGIPMATGGWWFSPSRLRDLLAIIIPMIEAPNRGPPSTLPPDREQVRTDQTRAAGHIGAKLDHARRRADCLATWASSAQRPEEGEEVLPILLWYTAPLYSQKRRRERPEQRRSDSGIQIKPGEKIRRNIDQHGSRIYR